MNVLLLTSHAIAEHDDLDMFTRMGVPCYSIGGAYDEANPFEGKRPPIPGVIRYPDLEAATNDQRHRMSVLHGDPGPNIDWAKARLAPEVIEWADTIIVHHFPEQWIGGNWEQIHNKRVIWRTCGQSDPRLEASMFRYARMGMQIVRYSPKEREAFTALGSFAGEDVMIRFGKDPAEWYGWNGETRAVGNITQHMRQRGDACGYSFWEEATYGLPVAPAGPGSEVMDGGIGPLPYDAMRSYLRQMRVYLYTGTRPASYTLGLIEAMMTGTPVVVMGAGAFHPSALWEAEDIIKSQTHEDYPIRPVDASDPSDVGRFLREILDDDEMAARFSAWSRRRAIDLFGLDEISGQWADFLGVPYTATDTVATRAAAKAAATDVHPAVRR